MKTHTVDANTLAEYLQTYDLTLASSPTKRLRIYGIGSDLVPSHYTVDVWSEGEWKVQTKVTNLQAAAAEYNALP